MSNLLEKNERILCIYEGTRLLSISYCNRKLNELVHQETLAHSCCLHDGANSEIEELTDKISNYSRIKGILMKNYSEVDEDALVQFITDEMVSKIKKSGYPNVTVWFKHVNKNTVEIIVSDDIFSTEITFSKKVYDESWEYNEEYDGYLDTAQKVCYYEPTTFLREIASTMKANIESQTNRTVSVSVF